MRRSVIWFATLFVFIFPALSQPTQAAIEMKLAHMNATHEPNHIGATKFAELVAQYTNSDIRITVFPNAQLGNERETIEAVKLGTLEMVVASSAPMAGYEPKLMLFDLPFLFRDTPHAHAVMDGPVGEKVAASLERHGFKLLSWMEAGFRNIITTKKRIMSPDDMRGVKFRVMENPVYMAMFRALGASAVPIPATEIYTSLQTGVVDGYEHPIAPYLAIKAYEVAKLVALTGHAYLPTPLVMNLKLFNQMTKAHQDVLLRAGKEAGIVERAYVADTLKPFREKLISYGVQFYEVDKRPFQEKVISVYRDFETKIGRELIDGALETK